MIKMRSYRYPVAFNCFCSQYKIVDYEKIQWRKHVLISNGKQLMLYMYLIGNYFYILCQWNHTILQALSL